MIYIEPLAQGYNPYNLFIQPYKDGWRNLTNCTKYKDPALHVVAGILLLIPIINTLVFLILRESTGVPVMNDPHRPLTQIPPQEQHLGLNLSCPIIHKPYIRTHLQASGQNREEFQNLDGQIHGARYAMAHVIPAGGLPEATFTQVGGVHQRFGGNHLCGYYALYFMYQAVSGERRFDHRETFHPFLERWTTMIAERRATTWLQNHEVPVALEVSVRGIDKYEIQYLIENDEALANLNQTNNCFLMEMDEWRQGRVQLPPPVYVPPNYQLEFAYSVPITPLGNKMLVNQFPLFFMLKERMHYYFVWAENPWRFQVVHSTGSSIHNPHLFNEGTFYDIIECLQNENINN